MKSLIELKCYHSDFGSFFEQYIKDFLPKAENVEKAHRLLVDYIDDDSVPLVLRRFNCKFENEINPFRRRGKFFKNLSRLFICSDNEAAYWFYCRMFENNFILELKSISSLFEEQVFPIGFSTDSKLHEDKTEWKKWGRSSKDSKFLGQKGWLHAHLHDVNEGFDNTELTLDRLKVRSFRFLHPANHFPIPSKSKFNNLVDTQPKDFGAVSEIKSFIFDHYSKRYNSIWCEFLEYCDSDIEITDGSVDL